MVGLTFKAAKEGFFDRAKVQKAVDKASRRVLSRFGAFVFRRSRSSIKKAPRVDVKTGQALSRGRRKKRQKVRDAVSSPGGPPYGHGAETLRKFIFFSYEAQSKSVVIGPVRLGGTVDPAALPALEYGGTSTMEVARTGQRKRITVRARPFMNPAFEAELPGLDSMWRDSVR